MTAASSSKLPIAASWAVLFAVVAALAIGSFA
jgi:hypothetical protein